MRDKVIGVMINVFAALLFLFGLSGLAGVGICVKGNDKPIALVAVFVVSLMMIGASLLISWLSEEALYR